MSQDKTTTTTGTGLTPTGLEHLNDSVSSLTQTVNQGMGAVGDSAADIEIYMGEMENEMHPGESPKEEPSNTMMQKKPEEKKEETK